MIHSEAHKTKKTKNHVMRCRRVLNKKMNKNKGERKTIREELMNFLIRIDGHTEFLADSLNESIEANNNRKYSNTMRISNSKLLSWVNEWEPFNGNEQSHQFLFFFPIYFCFPAFFLFLCFAVLSLKLNSTNWHWRVNYPFFFGSWKHRKDFYQQRK